MSIETSKISEQKRKKRFKNRISQICGTTTKGIICEIGIPEAEEREKGTEKYSKQ